MAPDSSTDELALGCQRMADQARAAALELATIGTTVKNRWLNQAADALEKAEAAILAANKIDLAAAPGYGLTPAEIDRLTLNSKRIAEIAHGLRTIAMLPDPVGEIIEGHVRPNGLLLEKVRVPLGVVFFIYESRPNVTADAAAICIKSGNAVILRGGKEALHSSQAIVAVLNKVAHEVGLPTGSLQIVETTNRDAVGHLLKMGDRIDVTIPRGGEALIRRVAAEATMPVLKHFDGNCHVYVDADADLEMAERILLNAKTQRMGVCNACESLLVHRKVAAEFLPQAARALAIHSVELRVDEETLALLPGSKLATETDWSTEYLGPVLSVKIVGSLQEAIAHINRYGSKHTDAIVTNCLQSARAFAASVDTAAVMINASTRFNDGGEFGLGAEIGISTDKLHARGPCGLKELTSYKYIVYGSGQIRE